LLSLARRCPPQSKESAEEVVKFVMANKGAIGYVPIDTDTANVKVIKVDNQNVLLK